MMKRPVTWVLLALVSVASAATAWRYFPDAFSILSLDIAMDREGALEAAREYATRDGLGPEDYQQAASFSLDSETQTFVELEGGGKAVFTAMIRDGLHAAYTWRVRHFREGETTETLFRFTPDGSPFGFVQHVPEDQPGEALDAEAARAIAEAQATDGWQLELSPYALVEQAQEIRPGGRVDHTFTYERAAPTLGEGRYRVRLTVSGDVLTELTRFVQIPEAFTRRYEGMRSANEAIGIGSVVGMVLLYVVGGIGVGLFFMMRRRWVLWRAAIFWGVAIAALQALAAVNQWPLLWMSYDTALPYSTFLLEQVVVVVATFVGFAGFFTLSFAAAETLTRRAFGSHPQLWRNWGRQAGSSTTILGHTVSGYLLVSVFLAYDVLLYLFATRTLGWWSPSEALIHPDVLATYVPWLGAIANSLQAGFWEECLFRAVPIAGAALIGDRFGKRGLFVAVAFVVQAAVFGAGHAPYPTQPSFARPVELILPSIGFGLLYLYFGLIPAIVLHFAFDVVWFALPIFASSASGVWVQQVMVVVVTLVPLWIVLWRRMAAGRWTTLDPALRNAAWSPPEVQAEPSAAPAAPAFVPKGSARVTWLGLGGAGFAAVVMLTVGGSTPAGLAIGREEAGRLARDAFAARGADLDDAWQIIPVPENGLGPSHEFVFETAGEARRQELIGQYLARPRWRVRAATFEGDVADRAEEWRAYVWSSGEVGFVTHTLPEGRAGASIEEDAARALAHAALQSEVALDAAGGDVREVSARPAKRAARTDWEFVFIDATVEPLPQGEPRVAVRIAGDEVVSTSRFIHIPEEWTRARRAAATIATIVQIGSAVLFGGILVIAAGLGVRSWSRGRFGPRLFVLIAGLMFVLTFASAVNNWPTVLDSLSTAQPLPIQFVILLGGGLVAAVILALLLGLVGGALPKWVPVSRLPDAEALRLGVAAGLAGAGVLAAAGWIQTPAWARAPDLAALGSFVPAAQVALGPVGGLLTRVATVVALLAAVEFWTRGWSKHRLSGALVLLVVGFAAVASPAPGAAGAWIAAGVAGGAALVVAYATLLRADFRMVPIALGTIAIVDQLTTGLDQAFPAALAGSLAAAVVASLVTWWLFRALSPAAR